MTMSANSDPWWPIAPHFKFIHSLSVWDMSALPLYVFHKCHQWIYDMASKVIWVFSSAIVIMNSALIPPGVSDSAGWCTFLRPRSARSCHLQKGQQSYAGLAPSQGDIIKVYSLSLDFCHLSIFALRRAQSSTSSSSPSLLMQSTPVTRLRSLPSWRWE